MQIYTNDSRDVSDHDSADAVTSVVLLITVINFMSIELKLYTSQH